MPADGMNAAVKAKEDIGASGWQPAKSYMIYQAPAMLGGCANSRPTASIASMISDRTIRADTLKKDCKPWL